MRTLAPCDALTLCRAADEGNIHSSLSPAILSVGLRRTGLQSSTHECPRLHSTAGWEGRRPACQWKGWHWEPSPEHSSKPCLCIGWKPLHCWASAEAPCSAWLRVRAGSGAAEISVHPGLFAQPEATCPKQLLMLLFWPLQRPPHIQAGHSTVQLILHHPMPRFPLPYKLKSLWGVRGAEWGAAKPCSHGP